MTVTAGARHRAALPPAEDEVLRLLRRSVAGLAADEPQLVLVIHQQLLVRLPAVTRLPGAGRPVARRLAAALLQAASVDDPARPAVEIVRRVGAENQDDGFGPEHDHLVRRVLLQTVRTVHRGSWSDNLGAAWAGYVGWLSEQLLAGAVRPPEPGPGPGRAARA